MKKPKLYADLSGKSLALLEFPDGKWGIGIWGEDHEEFGAKPEPTDYRFDSKEEAEAAIGEAAG